MKHKEQISKELPITALFVDIGGVLLTNGWDHHARKRAATNFKLEWAEMEARHRLNFATYEEGKVTLEEYLDRVVFYRKRSYTKAQFRRFIFEQSKPYPEMIGLIAQLKVRHGLKIAVVSNEARELNAYRIRKFKLDKFVDFYYFLLFCPRTQARHGHLSACVGHRPGTSRGNSLYRKHPAVCPGRRRSGNSRHYS